MRCVYLSAILVVLSTLWLPTLSAEIAVSPTATDGIPLITVVGTLELADGDRFARAASAPSRAVVVFSSNGGNLLAGLRIGQLIRLRQFATLVPDGARCASACAIAWLGGARRFMQPTARIGFHAAFSIENGVPVETGAGNALVGAYLSRLGLSDAAILYIEQAHPNEINWLTKDDAEAVGIEVAILPPVQSDSFRHPLPEITPGPAPQPQPPAVAPISQTAGLFASDYFAHWSEANINALLYFESVYASKVEFYGKLTDRSILLEQKRKFAERWPERVYTVRPSTATAHCSDVTATCLLEGVVDWDARNAGHGTRSAGSANYILKVLVRSGSVTIISESGTVISRETSGQ